MYSYQMAERTAQEQFKDRLQQAEHLRLIKSLQSQQTNQPSKVARWIGSQMVAAGLKLQGQASASMAQDGIRV